MGEVSVAGGACTDVWIVRIGNILSGESSGNQQLQLTFESHMKHLIGIISRTEIILGPQSQ